MKIYENKIKNMGAMIDAFGDEMVILFGDQAPDTLKDYCFTIDVLPVEAEIEVGDKIELDDELFEILAVGDVAKKNLENLGHLTINFTGEMDSLLPGAVLVEKKPCPKLGIGSVIKIVKK